MFSAFRLVGDSVIQTDASLRIVGMNPAARVYFNVPEREGKRAWPEVIRPFLLKESPPLDDPAALLGGAVERRGCAVIRRRKETRLVRYGVAAIPGRLGGPGYIITMEDRAARAGARDDENSPGRWGREFIANSHNGVIVLERAGGKGGKDGLRIVEWNAAAERILGFGAGETVGGILEELDPPPFGAASLSLLRKSVGEPGAGRRLENMEATRRDGSAVLLSMTAHGLGPSMTAAQFTDVTRLKEAAEEHHRLATAIEHAGEAILITDVKGDIQYVNPAFERATGYSKSEVMGKNPRILKSGRHGESFYKNLWETITSGKIWRGEIINRRKNGSVFYDHASIAPVKNERGEIINYVSVKRDITERKKAVETLRLSEQRISAIINTVGEGVIVIGGDSRIRFINKELLDIFGYSRGELIGEEVETLMPEKYREAHAAGMRRYLEGAPSKILGKRVELEGLRKSGGVFPLELRIQETRVEAGGDIFFTAAIRDISQRKEAEEALRKSQSRLLNAQHIARLGNWEWDIASGEFTWSDEVCHICGMKPHDFGGRFENFIEMAHEDDRERLLEAIGEAIREDRPVGIDHRIIHHGGQERIVHEQAEVVRGENGEAVRLLGTIQDVTERKTLEEELRRQAEKLEEMSSFKDKMLSIISHDLRSPLTSVIGLMNLLLKTKTDPLSERQRKILETMSDSAKHQLNLVENLTALSKARRGKIEINPAPTRAADIMRASASILRQMADDKGIRILEEADDDLWLEIDREKMIEVVNNLVANSVKFTHRGGTVILGTEEAGDEVSLVVSDTGVGMEPERLEKIFDFTEETTTFGTDGERGTGLGLAICQEITALNGGELIIESAPGAGTTVRLKFKFSKE